MEQNELFLPKKEVLFEEKLSDTIQKKAEVFVNELKSEGVLLGDVSLLNQNNEMELEKISDQLLTSAQESRREGLLTKLGDLFKKNKSLKAVILALELFVADTCFSKEVNFTPTKAIIAGIDDTGEFKNIGGSESNFPVLKTGLGIGDNFVAGQAIMKGKGSVDSGEIVLRENFKPDGSVFDLMKFVAEPIDISISIPRQEGNTAGMIWRLFRSGSGPESPYKIIIDVPFEYAKDFETSDPKDKKEMIDEIKKASEEVLSKVPAKFLGLPTFFEEDIVDHHKENNPLPISINSIEVRGFASPEGRTKYSLDMKDGENDFISEIRAENAATILNKVLEAGGYSFEPIKYKGAGQIQLSEKEKKELVEIAKNDLDFAHENDQAKMIHKLIEKYNDQEITEQDAKEKLDEIVGNKRKVSLEMEVEGKRLVFVVPGWLLWGVLLNFVSRGIENMRQRRRVSS